MSSLKHLSRHIRGSFESISKHGAYIDERIEGAFGHSAFKSLDSIQRRDQPVSTAFVFLEHPVNGGHGFDPVLHRAGTGVLNERRWMRRGMGLEFDHRPRPV